MTDTDQKLIIKNIGNSIKYATLSILPKSAIEGALFIILAIIVIIVINLFHYTMVHSRIKRESRCYREKINTSGGQFVYSVKATSLQSGVEIFEIIYDFKAKNYTINQVCPIGNITNKFIIPVYDMNKYTVMYVEKIYLCQEIFDSDAGSNIVYKGHPQLVRFMQFQNTDFFDSKLMV